MNQEGQHSEDLEYLHSMNVKSSEILSNVTERGQRKLYFIELMDVRFGRSTFNRFESFHQYFALSMNMKSFLLLHKERHNRVLVFLVLEDLY